MNVALIPRYLKEFDSKDLEKRICDVLIIGSGIAGLVAALEASKYFKTILITKGELRETATWYAQGGIASAISSVDSPELHFRDTIAAGAGLCNPEAVKVLVEEGPDCIDYLSELGTKFDKRDDQVTLTKEAGHSLPRILHTKDSTGAEVESTLTKQIKTLENLEIVEKSFVIDLITHEKRCVGTLVLDNSGRKVIFLARSVILASGGAGQLYSLTTNPEISTGDGLAMAFRAGADLMDLEFIQFHPTALVGKRKETDKRQKEEEKSFRRKPCFLITEALRGEGAVLRNRAGERFMHKVHSQSELAPRDVVAREIRRQTIETSPNYVFLDATNLSAERLRKRFPTIWKRCAELGYDLSKDWIPVSPAAHYMMGGIKTDLYGRTTLPGLFASGEVACNGIHGANRLASNSLLEGVVFSRRLAKVLGEEVSKVSLDTIYELEVASREKKEKLKGAKKKERKKKANFEKVARKLSELMLEKVGIFRSKNGLEAAFQYIREQDDILGQQFSEVSHFELQNKLILARLVTSSALRREESRGVHFRDDFPRTDSLHWKKHLVVNIKGFKDSRIQGFKRT